MAERDLPTVYLVVEPNPLLRADLAETLQYHDVTAAVIAVPTLHEALMALPPMRSLGLALVSAAPGEFAVSPLAPLIAEKGGRVVLMGGRAERLGEAAGYRVLHRPFSQEVILGLVED